MVQFKYKEMPMQLNRDLVAQINEQGKTGWKFITQAQRISPVRKLNGQPNFEIVLLYEKQIEVLQLKEQE